MERVYESVTGHLTMAGTDGSYFAMATRNFPKKYTETIGELAARGFEVWSMDWRGQGAFDRALKNPHKGHIDQFESYIADLA
jgi:lysophospholipase